MTRVSRCTALAWNGGGESREGRRAVMEWSRGEAEGIGVRYTAAVPADYQIRSDQIRSAVGGNQQSKFQEI